MPISLRESLRESALRDRVGKREAHSKSFVSLFSKLLTYQNDANDGRRWVVGGEFHWTRE